MTAYDSIVDALGNTPLVRLRRLARPDGPRIDVKMEMLNPGGSVKDRAAMSMLLAALERGDVKPGGTVVEISSGNTGVGLAFACAYLGLRCVVFSASGISPEKIAVLRAYGAEHRPIDGYLDRDHPDSILQVAERFVAETPGAWRANQYDNLDNTLAHVRGTGPEIWRDTDGTVTHLVAVVGTGGTITGTARALKEASAGRVRVIGADPLSSVYSGGDGAPKFVEGAGHLFHPDAVEDVLPEALDLSLIDDYIPISDGESIRTARDLARLEGILAGGSAGTAVAAALSLAQTLGPDDRIVVIAPDSGRAYLSTYFDEGWLERWGFADAPGVVTARALVASRPDALREPTRVSRLDVVDAAFLATLPGGDEPVRVVYERERTSGLPPAESIGLATAARFREHIGAPARDAVPGPTPSVGIGEDLTAALQRADAEHPGWSHVDILDEGRIVGLLSRTTLSSRDSAPHAVTDERNVPA